MKKILLVDDEQSSSEIIHFFIKSHSLPLEIVGECQNGKDAVWKIKKLKPDIVFLDIEMPGMNGLQVMEELKGTYQHKTSFVIITAYALFSYAQQAVRLGAKDFLLKPVMYDQFSDMMKRVLGYAYFDNPALNGILEHIDEHYMEKIKCEACAEKFNMSQSNIAHLFQKHLKMSFTDYLNEVRISKARQMMERGISIKDAAFSCGYNNLNYFYRIFKKKLGITPKEYTQQKAKQQKWTEL